MFQPVDRRSERLGLLLLLGAALAFSVMSVLVKLAVRQGLPVTMAMFARCAVALPIAWAIVKAQRIDPWGHDKKLLVLRALFGLGGLAGLYLALARLPLADATLIFYLNPILTALLAALLLGEAIGWRLGAALGLGVSGTLLVTRPSFLFGDAASLDPAGVAFALGGAVCSACAYVTVRRVTRDDHPDVVNLWFPLIAAPLTLPLAVSAWAWPTKAGWAILICIGAATHLAQVLLTRGLKRVPAGPGTAVGYAQIAFAAAFGMLVFGERLTLSTAAGACLIAAAALVVLRGFKSSAFELQRKDKGAEHGRASLARPTE